MMQSDSNLGGGTSGGDASGLNSTGGSTGGLGGSTGGGLSGTGGSTGGLSGTGGGGLSGTESGGLSGSSGGLSGTGGSTGGGLSGTGGGLSGTGAGVTEGGGFTTGDDFETHEGTYRRHYTVVPEPVTPPVHTYEEARTGYEIGHRAAANPTYATREFNDVEVDLDRESGGRLAAVKGYARHAFEWKKIVGALALAGGAWWLSRKLSETVAEMSEEEESDCRTYYESHPVRSTVPYEQARTVYVIGYAAARNPDYSGRSYDDVEPHLRSGFSGSRAGSYDTLRDFTRRGYERGSSRSPGLDAGTSGSAGLGGSSGGGVSGGGGLSGGTAGNGL
jgi:hypothetical protein